MRLKELRQAAGMTQAKVAKELALPLSTYRHYEDRTREMPYSMLIKVANLFDVSLDYLLEREYGGITAAN
jgi:repressor LexA